MDASISAGGCDSSLTPTPPSRTVAARRSARKATPSSRNIEGSSSTEDIAYFCTGCDRHMNSSWRADPEYPSSLCNRCGEQYLRRERKLKAVTPDGLEDTSAALDDVGGDVVACTSLFTSATTTVVQEPASTPGPSSFEDTIVVSPKKRKLPNAFTGTDVHPRGTLTNALSQVTRPLRHLQQMIEEVEGQKSRHDEVLQCMRDENAELVRQIGVLEEKNDKLQQVIVSFEERVVKLQRNSDRYEQMRQLMGAD